MGWRRAWHTTTLLTNGLVLVAGGWDANGTIVHTEVFDPASGRFAPAGPLLTARQGHAAVPLPDGSVLIAGGMDRTGATDTAERVDPSVDFHRPEGSMSQPRFACGVATLPSQRVVLIGGNGGPRLTTDVYDPKTGHFGSGPSMVDNVDSAATTLLPSGEVLLAGGFQRTSGRSMHLSWRLILRP